MPMKMALKNTSQDFTIKKDFIDMQLELKKFLEETDMFTLSDVLRDPLVVHSIEDYAAAYRELDCIKRINKTLRKLPKIKKRHVSLHSIIEGIDAFPSKAGGSSRISFANSGLKRSLFTLNSVKPGKELTKDKMVHLFKSHMKQIEAIAGFTIQKPVFSRNLSVSSSHSHLMKKIEKTGDFSQGVLQKGGSEITSTTSFRNGILRSTGLTEKGSKTQASTKPSNVSPRTNASQVGESSNQYLVSQNPHEALSSSLNLPKHPHNSKRSEDGPNL